MRKVGALSTFNPDAGRVLLAADAYLPWSGGSRVYYHNLYSRLAAQHGYRVSVLTSHTSGDVAFDANAGNSSLEIMRHGRSLPDWRYKRAPAMGAQLCRTALALARISPVALHCGDLFPQALNAMLIHKITGRPYLVYVHGDEISQTDQRRHQPKVRDAIYRNAAALIAANPYALSQLERILGNIDRCHLITPGVDFRYFYPGSPIHAPFERYNLRKGPVILTAARLVKKKGHRTLIRALPCIVSEFPELTYVIAGDGPERHQLESLVRELQLDRNVVFTGDVPHEALGDYYRAADIFVMANCMDEGGDLESFGMVFIEANACGKPVIGGRSGGTCAAIAEGLTGLLCEPNDESSVARCLLQLLRDPQRMREMGAMGAERAHRDFCWETRADALHSIIQGMVPAVASLPALKATPFHSPGKQL
jgi:phosphatidylinositol alpha-1,6-mannosyltransferase